MAWTRGCSFLAPKLLTERCFSGERKKGANRKLAETTQKHFLLMISASGDKAGILTPPRASSLGPMSVLQLRTGERVVEGAWVMLLPGIQRLEGHVGWRDVAVP